MLYFCTYFDSNYLVKGLALYRSLVRHAMPFRLWVLCFDDLTCEILQKLALPQVHPISIADLEYGDEQLLRAKGGRSRVEYYFTCRSSLLLYVLRNWPEVDVITCIDADLCFFSDPSPIYKELDAGSVLIVEHRFPPHLSRLEVHGIYNAGFLSFRRDDAALQCLHWWRERCLEWCYDRVEGGRFADQKYLNDWPIRFRRVVVVQHKGADLAPWNVANYCLRVDTGQVITDSEPLIFFHFHGFKQLRQWLYDPGLAQYGVRADPLLKRHIYGPYIRELQQVAHLVSSLIDRPYIKLGSIRSGVEANIFYRIARKIINQLSVTKMLLQGQLLVVIDEKVV